MGKKCFLLSLAYTTASLVSSPGISKLRLGCSLVSGWPVSRIGKQNKKNWWRGSLLCTFRISLPIFLSLRFITKSSSFQNSDPLHKKKSFTSYSKSCFYQNALRYKKDTVKRNINRTDNYGFTMKKRQPN